MVWHFVILVFNVLNTLWATLGWCHGLTLCDPCFQVGDWTLVCLPVVVEIYFLCNLIDMKTQVAGQQFALKASFSVFHCTNTWAKALVMSLLQQFHHLVCKAIWAINHPHVAITFVSDQNCRITQIHSQTCPALLIFKWKKCGAWAFCTFCRTAKVDFFLNGKNYDKCTGTYTHTHTWRDTLQNTCWTDMRLKLWYMNWYESSIKEPTTSAQQKHKLKKHELNQPLLHNKSTNLKNMSWTNHFCTKKGTHLKTWVEPTTSAHTKGHT